MKLYITGRCGGKTTHMVKWLMQDANRILITFNECEAKRIVHHFKLSPCDSERVMSVKQYLQSPKPQNRCIGIDNADIILEQRFWNKVKLISMTEEEE